MQNDKKIADEIEQALHSLDHLQRAEPSPFFFTRLEGRMRAEYPAKNIWRFVFHPALSLSALLLLLILNIGVLTHVAKTPVVQEKQTDGLQALAGEINHDISSVYNDK